jgi:hypothetical protein
MKQQRAVRKQNHSKVIVAYHQGAQDAAARKTPRPPKKGPERQAYINGFHGR